MPRPGHWVIIAGKAPTAFRAKRREVLVPTLKQLQRTQPDAELRWFEGGRLWASPDEAEAARLQRGPKRPATWRPGGEHKDPRARFELSRDEKRARFKRRRTFGSAEPGGKPYSGERPSSGPKSYSGSKPYGAKPHSGPKSGSGAKPYSGARPHSRTTGGSGTRPYSGGKSPSGARPYSANRTRPGSKPPPRRQGPRGPRKGPK